MKPRLYPACLLCLMAVQAACSTSQSDSFQLIETAQASMSAGRTEEANRFADEALAVYPQNYAAHGIKAQHFYTLGQHDQAIQEAQEALKSAPNHPAFLLTLASAYHQKALAPGLMSKDRNALYVQALNLYLVVSKHDPYDTDLYFKIGSLFEILKQPSDAIDAYSNAILIAPANAPDPFWKLANIYFNLGFMNEAFQTAKAGLTYHPDHLDLTLLCAQAEFALKQYDAALDRFTQAAELYQRDRQRNLSSPPPSEVLRQCLLGRAASLTAKGSALIELERPRDAAKLFNDAAQILSEVLPQMPANALERRSVEIKRQWLLNKAQTLNQFK